MSPMLHSLLPAAGRFGAARLFWLIIVVFLALLATLIVPLEVRLRRERRSRSGRGEAEPRRDKV